mgnify:FL=1
MSNMQKTKHENISKAISEFLRDKYNVKASHGREIAAAFLGHKSHASYLAAKEVANQLSAEDQYALVNSRVKRLRGIPEGVTASPLFFYADVCKNFEELR